MKTVLLECFKGAVNVQIAYLPPPNDYPDTAIGTAIALTDERDFAGSWILFALATETDAVLTDTGISHTDINAVLRSRNWFNQKIWDSCVNIRMLYRYSPNDLSKNIDLEDAFRAIENKYPQLR